MKKSRRERLRIQALAQTLFPPTTLEFAINEFGFVQADPIRSPAKAQELILRHRVKDYHLWDLEQQYSALGLEEGYLYAYGFMPQNVANVLHPQDSVKLSQFEKKVLELVKHHGLIRAKELDAELARLGDFLNL